MCPTNLLWERWDEVDRLLTEALEQPTDQQEAFLGRATEGDDALHELVLRLLERVRGVGDTEWGPSEEMVLAAFSGGDPADGLEDLPPGSEVGRYRIVRRLGRGGMATVYEAERADGAYQQRVALKVLRRGLDTEDVVRRFLTERQILSSLTHQNISRLLDGGSTPGGRPFLVMELVTGEPITVWADLHRLDVAARLRLFLSVAGAVHAAHRQLVVHRDIKPSNILVDADGRVRLLDFGIAKLLAEGEAHTDAGTRALTPDYASPEQIRGEPVTTGTDVFQLGLLLRELLTGVPPVAGRTRGEPPLRPSRVATIAIESLPDPVARAAARGSTPRKLATILKGELDIIVAKAMRPAPEERYASADELAADLHRYLRGHPIQAHPESALYRFRKFAGRHPLFVPGVALAQAVIGAFVIALAVQNRRVGRERDAAEAASTRALATQTFLVGFLRSPDPTAGGTPNPDITVAEALQRGRMRLATELTHQPEVRAALLEAMGRTFTGLGRYETADTLLRESLRIERALPEQDDERRADVLDAIGENYRRQRDFAPADSFLQQALELRTASGTIPDTVLAGKIGELSGIRRDLGDVDSAIALAARAVAVLRSAGDTTSPYYTATLGALGYVLRGAQRLDPAQAVYQEVLRRQELLSPSNPVDLALTHNNLGYLLRVKEDYPAAERSYRQAVRLAVEGYGEGHPETLMYRANLASVLELEGKLDEVVEIGRARILAAEREWPAGHWRVGNAHQALGRFMLRHDRAAEAVPYLEAGVRSYTGTIGADHTWTAVARAELGAALVLTNKAVEGQVRLDRAYAVLHERVNLMDGDSRFNLNRLVEILQHAGQQKQADRFRRLLLSD